MKRVIRAFLRYLTRRKSLVVLQLLGIAFGVAAAVGMMLASRSALMSMENAVDFLKGGSTHTIARPAGPMEEGLLAKIMSDPAVKYFAPVIDRKVRLRLGDQVRLLGLDPFLDDRGAGFQLLGDLLDGLVHRATQFFPFRRELVRLDGTGALDRALPLDRALEEEAKTLGRLVVTPVSKNLLHVFRLMEGAKKPVTKVPARAVQKVAVVGAGVMGGGIAQLLAYRGFEVRLKDIQPAALGHGLKTARELFDKVVKRGRLHKRDAERMMSAISPTLDYSGFTSSQLVIEAVVERMDVKKSVLREVESKVEQGAVLTSNTSALSISEMQTALQRPEDFCGMHFFNPVNRMPLVEIVRGERTSDEAIATVWSLTRKLDKTPLLVKDGPGFLVNRVLAPYMNEAGWLLQDGASIADIDRALVAFGMPMGPLRLLDEVGLDVAHHVSGILYDAFGARMAPAPALTKLPETKRLGRKGGLGFYTYEGGRDKDVDPAMYAALGLPDQRQELPRDVIQERCLLVMINEAARVLEEGIVRGAGDVDLGLITGTGFPPFRGGLLRYADSLGTASVLEKLERYERQLGARFAPAALIRQRAASGTPFYASAERPVAVGV